MKPDIIIAGSGPAGIAARHPKRYADMRKMIKCMIKLLIL